MPLAPPVPIVRYHSPSAPPDTRRINRKRGDLLSTTGEQVTPCTRPFQRKGRPSETASSWRLKVSHSAARLSPSKHWQSQWHPAATLAASLVDGGSPITLNSANFLIDLVGGGTEESEIRAIGSFTNGNAGGQLPTINWLDPNEPISYAGGIGLSAGVCLCTGVVTDADTDGTNASAGSGVGVRGADCNADRKSCLTVDVNPVAPPTARQNV